MTGIFASHLQKRYFKYKKSRHLQVRAKKVTIVGSTAQATCGCMQLLAIVFKERRNTRICFVYTQALAKFCLHRVYSWTLPYGKSYASVTCR